MLTQDIGFVFEAGEWRGQIMGTDMGTNQPDQFGQTAVNFLAAQWNTGAQQGSDQQGVLAAMYSFMCIYTLWADQCPHFPTHGATQVQVPEYELLNDIGHTSSGSGFLDSFSGQNGLLK